MSIWLWKQLHGYWFPLSVMWLPNSTCQRWKWSIKWTLSSWWCLEWRAVKKRTKVGYEMIGNFALSPRQLKESQLLQNPPTKLGKFLGVQPILSSARDSYMFVYRNRLNCDVGKTSTRHIYTGWAMAFTKEGRGAAEGAKIKEDEQEQRIFVNNVRWLGKCPGCVIWPSDLLLWGRLTWFRAGLVHLALTHNIETYILYYFFLPSLFILCFLCGRE